MSLRIAIPEPTSSDSAYNARALPPYVASLEAAGVNAIVIPLNESQENVARLLGGAQGVLLPGSGADIDPQIYGEERIPACGQPDPGRRAVDELLLQDAFNLHKPVLAICYGVQSLNVWRNGSLFQDLIQQGKAVVNHAPGRHVAEAHPVRIADGSRLGGLLAEKDAPVMVNSSHHQALRVPGDNLRVTAISPADEVIEAVELESPDHWVVGVQWHPERTYEGSAFSQAIFRAFCREVSAWRPRRVKDSVATA